jgi:hypothetical protein
MSLLQTVQPVTYQRSELPVSIATLNAMARSMGQCRENPTDSLTLPIDDDVGGVLVGK